MKCLKFSLFILVLAVSGCQNTPLVEADVVIVNGMIYDGTGEKPYQGMVAINGDKIVYVGKNTRHNAKEEVDAKGRAVSPGFINMLSWGYESLMEDGRGLSDLKQGVTLEVFGEGTSAGPSEEETFGQAMEKLEQKGVSVNIASHLGAATVRIQAVGFDNRKATSEEMEKMRGIVKTAMEEGAMGIGSSLIYAPGDYADTEELTELCKVAAEYGGIYISHMRNEDKNLMPALEELIQISQNAGIPAQIYHLKASREPNWNKLDSVIARVEQVRAEGLKITADMYTYNASSTGLTGVIPTWVQEGGHDAWMARMRDPEARKRLLEDIRRELADQSPEGILMVGFNKDSMDQIYRGKTIAEAAEMRGQTPEETIIDMVLEDDSRIQCIYFSMSEENIKKKIRIPWVSYCSDAGVYSDTTKDFRTHPRAFGSFARVLGKYSREEGLISTEEAVRKLSGFPAGVLGLKDRGLLKEGYYADVVIFDPEEIGDRATFEKPLQYAVGVYDVWVNGGWVLKGGEHNGVFSGKFVRKGGVTLPTN